MQVPRDALSKESGRACGDVPDVETGREWHEARFRAVDEKWYVRRCVEWAAVNAATRARLQARHWWACYGRWLLRVRRGV